MRVFLFSMTPDRDHNIDLGNSKWVAEGLEIDDINEETHEQLKKIQQTKKSKHEHLETK